MRNVLLASALAGAMTVVAGASISGGVLLIPESSNDTVGMYDAFDGRYLGDLITAGGFSTPINAVVGPDGLIYVSDQVGDNVKRFDTNGVLIDEFVGAAQGLNNIRGIDFRGTELFVTSGDDYVARFDSAGNRLTDFINDGSDPFDIFFLPDGRSLLADIQGSDDNVRLYSADGSSFTELFNVSFPEQIQSMWSSDHYLNAAFSAGVLTEFGLDGTIHRQVPFSGGRGVYELGNGRWLATSGAGVFSIDPDTGAEETIRSGVSARFIELMEPIPAPGAITLLGLAGLATRRRRRR